MDKLQKILVLLLISISAVSWTISSVFQADMMSAMTATYDPLSVMLFLAVWTAGMAAMMFPAISPVVLLYNRIIRASADGSGVVLEDDNRGYPALKMMIFVGSYLAVWSLAGLALLLIWTVPMGSIFSSLSTSSAAMLYGATLIAAGLYQFSPLKSKCLGYCESPMSLFMRRWRKGAAGSLTMGTYHGLYCLGCCWPYFLIMVALGWMDIMWMALFAGIILGEKMWAKGIWFARAAGVGFVVAGALSVSGLLVLTPAEDHMAMPGDMEMPSSTGPLSGGPTMDNLPQEEEHPSGPPQNGMQDGNGMKM